jgi:DNA-binding FadR family transcriptional regulator
LHEALYKALHEALHKALHKALYKALHEALHKACNETGPVTVRMSQWNTRQISSAEFYQILPV